MAAVNAARGVACVTLLACAAGCVDVDMRYNNPKVDRAHLDLKNIESALRLYQTKKGSWPPADEGLSAVQRAGILIELPNDPWGHPYRYAIVNGVPVVTCYGADGKPGGRGADADLSTEIAP